MRCLLSTARKGNLSKGLFISHGGGYRSPGTAWQNSWHSLWSTLCSLCSPRVSQLHWMPMHNLSQVPAAPPFCTPRAALPSVGCTINPKVGWVSPAEWFSGDPRCIQVEGGLPVGFKVMSWQHIWFQTAQGLGVCSATGLGITRQCVKWLCNLYWWQMLTEQR